MAAYLAGPYAALAYRRGITHGWLALLLLPFVVAGAMLAWDRWVRRRRVPGAVPARAGPLLALSAVGVLTHPTLDWMNSYGMRWGAPSDWRWSYGDALFIIDPWIWLALGGSIFLATDWSRRWLAAWVILAVAASTLLLVAVPVARVPWLLGLATVVGLRVAGRPAGARARRALVVGATGATCFYVAVLVAADERARAHVAAEADARGLAATDVMVAPVRGNPFVSDVELATPDGYVPGVHRWLGSPRVELRPEGLVPLLSAPSGVDAETVAGVVARARDQRDVHFYLVWSRYPYVTVERDGTGWRVHHADARYDDVAEVGSLGGVSVRVPAAAGPTPSTTLHRRGVPRSLLAAGARR